MNILASLDRELFIEKTNLFYPDDKIKYYLAYMEEKIIGMTGLYIEGNNEAWLGWFGILPQLRNQGYGKLLLEETIKIAKNNGHKVLRLYTDKKENATAIKLYEKLGFTGEKYSFEKDKTFQVWLLENAKHMGRGAYEFSLTDSYLPICELVWVFVFQVLTLHTVG